MGSTACSLPNNASIPSDHWISVVGVIWILYVEVFKKRGQSSPPVSFEIQKRSAAIGVFIVLFSAFSLPFFGGTLLKPKGDLLMPPDIAEYRPISGGFELIMPGQPSGVMIVWYQPNGSERHHALKTCLGYRGRDLVKTEVEGVQTDGEFLFREFFFANDELIDHHFTYLKKTLESGVRQVFI